MTILRNFPLVGRLKIWWQFQVQLINHLYSIPKLSWFLCPCWICFRICRFRIAKGTECFLPLFSLCFRPGEKRRETERANMPPPPPPPTEDLLTYPVWANGNANVNLTLLDESSRVVQPLQVINCWQTLETEKPFKKRTHSLTHFALLLVLPPPPLQLS